MIKLSALRSWRGGGRDSEYWQIILGPLLLLVVLFARGGIDGLLRGRKVRS